MRIGPALVIAVGILVGAAAPAAAAPDRAVAWSSLYAGESAFTSEPAGGTAQVVAVFVNDGTEPWLPGGIGLLVCAPDRSACGVPSPNASYSRGWYSSSVYATIPAEVPPGGNGFFRYEIGVPLGTPPGTAAVFNGEVGFIASGTPLHPEGYFHVNSAQAATGPRLAAAFLAQPIPADGRAISILRAQLLDAGDEGATILRATRDAADAAFCSLDGGDAASSAMADGHVDFTVTATEDPGFCHITVSTMDGAVRSTATLETRSGGTATRLTVSGSDSPQIVGAGRPITVAVDVDDVNVALVAGDDITVVHIALDPGTCTGAPGGDVYLPAGPDAVAAHGRVWLTVRSHGSYPACRAAMSASGLVGARAVLSFASGPADHFSCAFTPPSLAADGTSMSTATVELRDAFGNGVLTALPYTLSFTRSSGAATAAVSDEQRGTTLGATWFAVRAGSAAGVDEYVASIASGSPTTLPVTDARCAITVHAP